MLDTLRLAEQALELALRDCENNYVRDDVLKDFMLDYRSDLESCDMAVVPMMTCRWPTKDC